MDKKRAFGCRNWFIKYSIYKYLLENEKEFGLFAVEYKRDLKLSDEQIQNRYKLCNILKYYFDMTIDSKDIMAVLYKISFTIVQDGRLYNEIMREQNKQNWANEVFEESVRMAQEDGYDV